MGLSPRAFKDLIGTPVPAAEGALVLRRPESLCSSGGDTGSMIAATPVIAFAEWMLNVAGNDGAIPATKAGYVKPSIVTAACENGVITRPLDPSQGVTHSS